MARKLLAGLPVAALLVCAMFGETRANTGDSNDQETAKQLVEQALAHEAAGDVAARDNALFAALQFDPSCEPALWRSGYVLYLDQWIKFDEVPQTVDEQPRLVRYLQHREAYADTADDQLKLAQWCVKNRLPQQARSHFTQVLEHDPQHPVARARLGYLWVNGRWILQSEIQAARELARRQRWANRIWAPRLERIAEQIASSSLPQRQEGLKRLAEIDDPLAIASIETMLGNGNDDWTALALETISRLPHHEATLSLAQYALYSSSDQIRAKATSLLKQRHEQEFVPLLLASMSTPLVSRKELYRGRGGHILFRHLLAREGVDAQRLLVMDRNYLRIARVDGEAEDTAARAVVDAQRQAQQRERQIAEENLRISQQNARVAEVLAATTGQPFGPRPKLWWEWWNDHNGVFVEGNKEVISVYESETVTIADQRPDEVGGGGGGADCLRAGTLIWTERGFIAIEQIQVGDRVLSQDPDSGELAYKPVLRTTVRPPDKLFRVVTENATLQTSSGHPFFVQGQGWVPSRLLKAGDRIQGLKRPAMVVSTEAIHLTEETYNLVVADFHSYFVGEARILSHDNTIRALTNSIVPGLERSTRPGQ